MIQHVVSLKYRLLNPWVSEEVLIIMCSLKSLNLSSTSLYLKKQNNIICYEFSKKLQILIVCVRFVDCLGDKTDEILYSNIFIKRFHQSPIVISITFSLLSLLFTDHQHHRHHNSSIVMSLVDCTRKKDEEDEEENEDRQQIEIQRISELNEAASANGHIPPQKLLNGHNHHSQSNGGFCKDLASLDRMQRKNG